MRKREGPVREGMGWDGDRKGRERKVVMGWEVRKGRRRDRVARELWRDVRWRAEEGRREGGREGGVWTNEW